jgi:cytochrome c-type biogenesis protein CcmF
MLGGFWAYEVLGWGGFWGWDPVENASLLPWLVAVALVHTMLVQKRTKGLVRTNFVIAIISFILVLYATFLTRSGVLGDISVHSFGEPGKFIYSLLVASLVVFFLIGIVSLIIRSKEISSISGAIDFKGSSREFFLSLVRLFFLLSQ